MKKIVSIINMVAVLTVLVLAGLALFLVGTDRLDKEKMQTMLDLVRHPGTPAGLRQQVYEVFEPAPAATSTAPATTKAAPLDIEGPVAASSQERLEYTRQAMEHERLRLEHEAQELQHRQQLLDQKRALIDTKLTELDLQKKTFEAEVGNKQNQAKKSAFDTSLDLYNELKPKQVKDLFISLSPDAAAEFFKAMEPSRAGKIIAEFKAPEEKAYIAGVLDKIRAGATSGTPNASDPSAPSPADSNQAKTP